jgi:hypothetical protein
VSRGSIDGRNHPEWKERTDVLKDQLGVVIKLEETLVAAIKADQACTRVRRYISLDWLCL